MARWDWTEADLEKAKAKAEAGQGRQLAKLIKATSEDDLASALSRHYPFCGFALGPLLAHCLGMREFRQELRKDMAERRRERRRQAKEGAA
mgnify:CR=1 FL=1